MRTELLVVVVAALLAGCAIPPSPAPATPLPSAPPAPPVGLREPERVRRYVVSAYVDPEDQTVRHEAHVIHRIEAASRWKLDASEGGAPVGEIEQLAEATPSVMSVTKPKLSVALWEEAIGPDGNGVIDLSVSEETDANPFAVRSAEAAKEIVVTVSGVIGGARPAAIVNGHVLEAGGTIDGLRVRTVESDAVVFEHGRRRFRIPVSQVSSRVRMAN